MGKEKTCNVNKGIKATPAFMFWIVILYFNSVKLYYKHKRLKLQPKNNTAFKHWRNDQIPSIK